MNSDLTQLAHDIETATPHQTPPWADSLTLSDLTRVLQRAEQIAANDRALRNYMRKPN